LDKYHPARGVNIPCLNTVGSLVVPERLGCEPTTQTGVRPLVRDILPSCVAAYIDALSNAEAVQRVRAAAATAPAEAVAA
jgi:hypothetical protein